MIQYPSLWLTLLLVCPFGHLQGSLLREETSMVGDWRLASPQGQIGVQFYPVLDEQEELTTSVLSENEPTCFYSRIRETFFITKSHRDWLSSISTRNQSDGQQYVSNDALMKSTFNRAKDLVTAPAVSDAEAHSQLDIHENNPLNRPKKPKKLRETRVDEMKKSEENLADHQVRSRCITQTTTDSSAAFFKDRSACGKKKPRDANYYIKGEGVTLGYRASSSRIILIDGFGYGKTRKRESRRDWDQHQLDKTNLTKEAFRKLYPLRMHGLVVAINNAANEILFWMEGEPQQRAVLFRQSQGKLIIKAVSSSKDLITTPLEDGDMVLVASYSTVDSFVSEEFTLELSDDTESLAQQISETSSEEFETCIVARVAVPKTRYVLTTLQTRRVSAGVPGNQGVATAASGKGQLGGQETISTDLLDYFPVQSPSSPSGWDSETGGLAAALHRWTCYDQTGRESTPVNFCNFIAMDFVHIVNHLAYNGNRDHARVYLQAFEDILEDETIVTNILSQGPFPQVEEIMQLRAPYRLLFFKKLAPFMSCQAIEYALVTTVGRQTNVDIFKVLLATHTTIPMDFSRRIRFVDEILAKIDLLPYTPDYGDWNEGGPFQRFFRTVVQLIPDLIPCDTEADSEASFIINNHGLLSCMSPALMFSENCTKLYGGDVHEGFMAIDFYIAVTDFKQANFTPEDYWQRRNALLGLMNGLSDSVTKSWEMPNGEYFSDQMTALEAEKRSMDVLGWLLGVEAYSALEFYCNESGISLSSDKIVKLVAGTDALPLVLTQLLYHAERSVIEIPGNCGKHARQLIQLYNQLISSGRRDPCSAGAARKIQLPEFFSPSKSISDILIRAYLLFWFDIPLRHTKLIYYSDPLDPTEYAGAIDAMLERYCAIHHQSRPAFTHARISPKDEESIAEEPITKTEELL
ncbi:hypothetical protein PSACC_01196 [Paramicrosporidium saccamoebae]|uniref:HECT domain-containing protein n=1 Tax=Paramicrosporidium saccamoebae TaxID=1246581 RepID=A0A2H9TML8_9FUNG|nr:hypothetical protein PSACC_01196 [Paramicrosporidium saccamoebae]